MGSKKREEVDLDDALVVSPAFFMRAQSLQLGDMNTTANIS